MLGYRPESRRSGSASNRSSFLAAGAVAEVVVPLGLAKAGLLSRCTVVLGIVAATEERSEEDA
jgi:hypothetical protein